MYRHPPGHPAWLDVMDPDRVVALAEESEPEEDPNYVADEIPGYGPLVDPVEGPVEGPAEEPDYMPADVPVSDSEEEEEDDEADFMHYDFLEESDDEGILEDVPYDDAQPTECLTEEEVSVPSSPVLDPHYQPCFHGDKGHLMRRTARISVRPHPDTYAFVDRAVEEHGRMNTMHRTLPDITPFLTCGTKRKAPEGQTHFEVGESSQAQPPAPPPTACAHEAQIGALYDRIHSLDGHIRSLHSTCHSTIRRADQHDVEERQDTEAIRTLIRLTGDTRVNVTNLQMHSEHVVNVTHGAQIRLDATDLTVAGLREENRQLRQQFVELVNYLAARFGR